MRPKMWISSLVVVMAVLLAAGFTVCAAVSLSNPAAQAVATDTARLYFAPENTTDLTGLYAVIGHLPLDEWQSIRVFGETFKACAVGYDGGETILSVEAEAMQRCSARP